ncbi:MAG: PIN domain-containing protein [Candidatus Rokuibacteriota bacterium]
MTERDFAAIVARMRVDRAHWELVEVGQAVLDEAEALVQRAALRTLDAVHVASALTVQAALGLRIPFITADSRQREAARGTALDVVWVGS